MSTQFLLLNYETFIIILQGILVCFHSCWSEREWHVWNQPHTTNDFLYISALSALQMGHHLDPIHDILTFQTVLLSSACKALAKLQLKHPKTLVSHLHVWNDMVNHVKYRQEKKERGLKHFFCFKFSQRICIVQYL